MKLLRGFTVLDLGTFITAPYAAMLLAELGADVIKVERPEGGDPFRWFAGGLSSPHFQAHNRHKRSVALDYTTQDGLKLLHSLIEHADALVINVRPGVEQRLGIDAGHDGRFQTDRSGAAIEDQVDLSTKVGEHVCRSRGRHVTRAIG